MRLLGRGLQVLGSLILILGIGSGLWMALSSADSLVKTNAFVMGSVSLGISLLLLITGLVLCALAKITDNSDRTVAALEYLTRNRSPRTRE